MLQRALTIGEKFRERFVALQARCPLIHEVRIRGCMIGLQLTVDGAAVVRHCMERGLLLNVTQQTVIRLLPAINLSDAELEEGCGILEEVLLSLDLRA
ncbi:MAG: aminotransferase class III-fold pyridoxal phosphate-dependent enzyme [Gemmataceae bacterium]